MTTENMDYLSFEIEHGVQKAERMVFIDFRLRFTGTIKRSDITEQFGVADSAASKEIAEYKNLAPGNVEYDRTLRSNAIIDTYQPLFNISAEQGLGMLANGFNKNLLVERPIAPYQRVGVFPKKLNVELVAAVTSALSNRVGLGCKYMTANSDNYGDRMLFPTAIFYDGKTWMFRAYHRDSDMYKNFNFARVLEASVFYQMPARERETIEADSDWNTKIPLLLRLHPSLAELDALVVRKDFGIESEKSEFTYFERAALVYYLIDNWNVDVGQKPTKKSEAGFKFHLVMSEMLEHFESTKRILKRTAS
tara:strand:+ start:4005 stop:4925 length:921 start_codon:yes stop_codon:yes gene_type:complete